MSSNSALITITDAQVDVAKASVDLSPSTAGNNLAFVFLGDAAASITGRNLAMTAGSALARVQAAFLGVAGAEGTVALEDYKFDTAPATVLSNVTAGSVLSNARPSTNPVLIYAPEMRSLGGSPVLDWVGPSATNRANVFLMDSATAEDVGCAVVPPVDWKTVNITLIWTNMAASSGDVRWGLNRVVAGDGEDVTSNTSIALTATAPSTAGILKYTSLASGIAVTGGKILVLRLRRDGAHAADTLANDAGIVGVLVEKAS